MNNIKFDGTKSMEAWVFVLELSMLAEFGIDRKIVTNLKNLAYISLLSVNKLTKMLTFYNERNLFLSYKNRGKSCRTIY